MDQEFAQIELNLGQVAIVDAEDVEYLSQWNWNAIKVGHTHYACTAWHRARVETMHNCVMRHHGGVRPDNHVIDHINGNGLDNRRCNLRIASRSDNAINVQNGRVGFGASRFRGVWLSKDEFRKKRWVARIRDNGEVLHLGHFATEEEAARAYDAAAEKLHGEFYEPNFKEPANDGVGAL